MPQVQRVWDENFEVYGVHKVWRQMRREHSMWRAARSRSATSRRLKPRPTTISPVNHPASAPLIDLLVNRRGPLLRQRGQPIA